MKQNTVRRNKSGDVSGATKIEKGTERKVREYVIVLNRRRNGELVLRELHDCRTRQIINADGSLATSSSCAEIASPRITRAMAKKLRLIYRKLPTRFSLRLDGNLTVVSGYLEKPRRAKPLTTTQLRRVADQLNLPFRSKVGQRR